MTPAEFIDDPRWADFLPEKPEAAKKRHLPTHEDCSRLDPKSAAAHLRLGGTLGAMAGYEERPGQLDMLGAIVRAFNAREHLMIEAGTGVGKSLAYLVPSILWAHLNDTPVVISTATRNLQSQLISSDIPRALKVLEDEAEGGRWKVEGGTKELSNSAVQLSTSNFQPEKFKVALLKGRANYLCLRAVADFFAAGYWTMDADEQAEMPHFIDWLHATPDGDLDRYEGLPRSLLTCPGEECGGRRCPFYTRCFVYRARKNAAEAHLVVANHALVLAEATNPGGGLLPPHGRVIFDEAHNLEDIATEFLSNEFSLPALTRLLNRLIRRGRGKRSRPGGILASVERQLQKGVLAGGPVSERVGRLLKDATALVVRVVGAAENLADLASLMLKVKGEVQGQQRNDRSFVQPSTSNLQPQIVRYCVADGRRRHSLHGLFRDYEPDEWSEENFFAAQTAFENELAALVDLLHDLRDTLEDSAPEGELNYCADLAAQVGGMAESFVAFANETNFVLRGEKDTHAYWIERVRPPKRPAYVRLVAAPLSVADDLRKMLWDVKDSCVLSSATLRVGNDFKYMARRLGFGEEAGGRWKVEGGTMEGKNSSVKPPTSNLQPSGSRYRCLTAASPFDYFRQSLVLAPDCLPDPAADPAKYAEALAMMLADLFATTNGRALVLFTSYEMMNAVAAAAREGFEKAGLTLLVQGAGLSRESMTLVLKTGGRLKVEGGTMEDQNSSVQPPTSDLQPSVVLFGAQSFWEGVDVAGEALSCVVLARLPFAQRTDPIVEARSERIERTGGSSFRDYYLPEAVIKFRQGFGRLIRTKRDRGVVVITDPRIVTKSYGAVFRKSIPASVHTVTDLDDLLSRVSDFFAT